MKFLVNVMLAALLTTLLAACGSAPHAHPGIAGSPASPTATAPPLTAVRDPGHVTGVLAGPCHTRDNGQLPDPGCTPGSFDPAMSASVICAPGYSTASYRAPESETTPFKYQTAEPAYGMHDVKGELDHLVSLELGGSNDATNLWVEPGPIPNAKDSVENALHAWVCSGGPGVAQGRLTAAQKAIAADWMTAEQVLGIKG